MSTKHTPPLNYSPILLQVFDNLFLTIVINKTNPPQNMHNKIEETHQWLNIPLNHTTHSSSSPSIVEVGAEME
jgi:hypothetical protein